MNKKTVIEYIPNDKSGSQVIVNGVVVGECLSDEEFENLKISELVDEYNEMMRVKEKYQELFVK